MPLPFEHLSGLILFSRIAHYGSLAATAKHLELSRSAVSKQLAAFEKQIGAKLIQRTTRKLSLTELGEQILREAHRAEAALGAVEHITEGARQDVRGKLRVSCSTSIGRKALMPIVHEFLAAHPLVELELGLEDRVVDLIGEHIDVAIRIGYLPDSSMIARRLGELSWQIVASPDYLQRRGIPSTPEDLNHHSCLFYRSNQQVMNQWRFIQGDDAKTIKVQGPLAINDACALVDAAINGLGILLIDKALLHEAVAKQQLIPLLDDYQLSPGFPVYAVYPAREYLPAKTTAFVDFLLERLSPKLL